jgi:hypothetical protein
MTGKRKARTIINHAGNCDVEKLKKYGWQPQPLPLRKKCSRPFREITVHWDGTVPLCCMDWCHEFIIEKVGKLSLPEIWESEIMNVMRHLLYNKDRGFLIKKQAVA